MYYDQTLKNEKMKVAASEDFWQKTKQHAS